MARTRMTLALAAAGVVAGSGSLAAATTTLRVSVPGSTPSGDTVFVAGSFQNWNPGDPAYALARQPDGRWQITLNLPDGQPVEFKFTRGNWERVEKGPNGEEIANRQITPNATETHDFTVATWADIGTIVGHVENFTHAPFLGGRRIWVYLPPGYFESTDRYPVLYMHDGQNLFDVRTSFAGEWKVDEACEALIGSGAIEPLIVVGIENSAARCVEYTPWINTDPSVPCGGGGADVYLGQIRDVLIPEINARYRTRTGPSNTWMSGSSLGGLISHYVAYAYPHVWGRVAAVSTYFPWANRMLLSYAAGQPKPPVEKLYQDMGSREFGFTDADGDGVDDFIEDLRAMRDILRAQGFVEGEDLLSVEGEEHTHWEFYWAQRFPALLRFLANPGPTVDVPAPRPGPALGLAVTPNPLRREARIGFTLAHAAEARLEVVDARGRRVTVLAEGILEAGQHRRGWNARDAAGRGVPPGVYWVRLRAGEQSTSQRVVVLP